MGDIHSAPLISTTLLNWNRADLLRRTLESYRATVTVPYELFIVDNGSSDGSREVIEEFCATTPAAQAIYLPENIGGAAVNHGLERSSAALLHISENDFEYRRGWVEEALQLFERFPELGQLALCAPVPEDEEIWESKPAILRSRSGVFLYEAVANVGTSCLLRRELWDAGIRVGSITDKNGVQLPDDPALSAAVKHAGYMCAWAPRYLARNLGHEAGEFNDRPDYYARSYDAKQWLGIDGLNKRIAAWHSRPRVRRASLLFQGETLQPEASLAAAQLPEPHLWSMFDGWTADVETLEFVYGLVRAVKPRLVLESHAWRGYGGEAIGRALAQNGFGRLISVERDPDCRRIAADRLSRAGVDHLVRLADRTPTEQELQDGVDLLLLDGSPDGNTAALRAYACALRPGALVVAYRSADAGQTAADGAGPSDGTASSTVLSLPTPRGLTVRQWRGEPAAAQTPPRAQRATAAPASTALLIAGMHRSGTSALARVLHMHGLELGASLLGGNAANERGFWEHPELMLLNEAILDRLNRPWLDPRSLPRGWWEDGEVKTIYETLVRVLQGEFAGKPLWGAKDPRLCRLLPLWLRAAADLGAAPAVVIPVRNPYEVADSLRHRDNLSQARSLTLWLRYMLEAERNSREVPRAFTSYDGLLSDWRGTLSTIVERTGLSLPVFSDRIAAKIETFLSPSMRHHRDACPDDAPHWLRPILEMVYAAFLDAAASGTVPDTAVLDRASAELDAAESAFAEPAYAEAPACSGPDHGPGEADVMPLTAGPGGEGIVPAAAPSAGPAPQPENGAHCEDRMAYADWIRIHGLHESDAQLMAERMVLQWQTRPAVHLVVPVRTGEEQFLVQTLQSLSAQLYPGWGLTVVAEQACPEGLFDTVANLEWRQAGPDPAAMINQALADTEADWVGIIRPGDRLAPHCLFVCLDHLTRFPGWALIYVDEDRIDVSGDRSDPWFKTDADWDLLRSRDSVGGFCLVRREAVQAQGGYCAQPGLEHYELALGVLERHGTQGIGHVAQVLYHCGPVTDRMYRDEEVGRGRHRILTEHIERCGEAARITEGLAAQSLRVCYQHAAEPMVSIIVTVRDDVRSTKACIDSLQDIGEYKNRELLVVHEGGATGEMQDYLDLLGRQRNLRVLTTPQTGNRAAACNAAAKAAQGEFLVFVDARALFIQERWLENLLCHARRADVGAVAPRVVGPDETVTHSALILGLDGVAADAFAGRSVWDEGYFGRALTDQGVSAVPGACVMVHRTVFQALDGFDEHALPEVWHHADFCLRLGERGQRVVWTPYALLGWQESASQAHPPVSPDEEDVMLQRWLGRLAHDPAYNVNLSLSHRDFRPRVESTANWDATFPDRPRVLGIPADTYACGEYRVLAPLNALADASLARCGFTAPQEGTAHVPSVAELQRLAPDTLLLQATLDDGHLEALERYRRFNNTFHVFDMDELKIQGSARSPRSQFLYRDTEARIRRALRCCDRLIVTSEAIADACGDMIRDIRVVPTYLPRTRWDGLSSARHQGRRPRVGWCGGQQDLGDLQLLLPVVEATAEEVEWVFFGMCPEAMRPFAREVHEFGRFAEYPSRLAGLNLDLAVAPLEDNPFNAAKGNLRVLEYGILGWPVVCTDIEPYRRAPVARVPNKPAAWIRAIRERIHDPDAAALEGDRLREWVTGGWMLEDHLDEWLEALSPAAAKGRRLATGGGLA